MAEKSGFQKILVPTDFSDVSKQAASTALDLARRYKASIYALHVVDIHYEAAGFYIPHLSFEKLNKDLREAARGMLQRFCNDNFRGFRKLEQHVLVGAPDQEILKVLKGSRIDLVVMGHGRVLNRFFFGSTADKVLKKALCPVLIVPHHGD